MVDNVEGVITGESTSVRVNPWNCSLATRFSNAGKHDAYACASSDLWWQIMHVQQVQTYRKQIWKFFITSWENSLPFSKLLQVPRTEFLGFFNVLEIVNSTAQSLGEWVRWSNRLFPSLISVSLWFKDFLHLLFAASLGHFVRCLVILPIIGNGRGHLKHHVAIETQ